ncbi:unnamed protein product [Closterium sp. NIES-53]
MVPNRSGRSSLPFLILLLLASSPPHSTFSPTRAAPIGAQLPPASVPPGTRNRGSNSTSVDTPPPRAWHPPLILPVGSPHYAAHERLRWSPRQRHVFGRHSARLVEGNAAFQHDADGEEPAVRGRSLAATAATGAGAGECDAEWMLLWPTQGCWRPRMTTAKGGTSAPSSSHRLATAQSVTSAGAEIAQASAPAPTSSDGGGGDGGSAPPAGSEARLTPENEIIGVCRSGASPHLSSPHFSSPTSPHLSPHLPTHHLSSPDFSSPHLSSPHLPLLTSRLPTSPHLSTPHLSSPHFSSPTSPHLSPHITTPNLSPRLSSPLLSSPHLSSPHLSSPLLSSPLLSSPLLTSPLLTSPHLTSPHLSSPHLSSPHLSSPLLTSRLLISHPLPFPKRPPQHHRWMQWRPPSTITIAPDWNGQTWHGWGTSLAWFANYIGKLPEDQFTLIMDLLFDKDKGVGLNLARYTIGGSANYTNSPQFLNAAWETRILPGFRVQPNGPYDWTADWRLRKTMLAALTRNVDEVEAISGSPPWWMTVSGDTAGTEQYKCNLKPEYFQAYTEYQASVIEHYRTHWNVTFSTMNPANEALEGWWIQGARGEGCNFNPQEMSTLIQLLTATLEKRKLPTKVAGFDSFVGATLRYAYKFPAAVKAGLFRFNVHGYIPPPPNTTDTRRYIEGVMVGMHRMATGLGKEVWVSEVGPMWVTGNDVGVMMFTARQIVQAVNIMGASAWTFWQAVSAIVGTNREYFLKWGLLAIRHYRLNDTEVKPLDLMISKKLYMLQQFVRGAPRGSLPLQIDTSDGCQHCIAAFFHPVQHFVSIFIVNQRNTTHSATFQFEDFVPFQTGQQCVVETYRTSATENNTLVATRSYTDVPASIQVAALGSSMTSVRIHATTTLDLKGLPYLSDSILYHVSKMTHLKHIALDKSTPFSPEGIKHLYMRQLESLELTSYAITDSCLEGIGAISSLKYLDLNGSHVTDAGLEFLAPLSRLKVLVLPSMISDAGMEHIQCLPALEELDVSNSLVTGKGVALLKKLPRLRLIRAEGRGLHALVLSNLPGVELSSVALGYMRKKESF